MNYSPIIAPMLALTMLWASTWLATIPLRLSLVLGEDFDPPLSEEDRQCNEELLIRHQKFSRASQNWPFYILCLSLAHIDPGSKLAGGLAWVFAVFWPMAIYVDSTFNKYLRCGTTFVAHASMFALVIYAGVRVTYDLLVMHG